MGIGHWALGIGHWALGRLHLLERGMLAPHRTQQVERLHHGELIVVVALGHGAEEAAALAAAAGRLLQGVARSRQSSVYVAVEWTFLDAFCI